MICAKLAARGQYRENDLLLLALVIYRAMKYNHVDLASADNRSGGIFVVIRRRREGNQDHRALTLRGVNQCMAYDGINVTAAAGSAAKIR